MKQGNELDWTDVVMAANAPVMTKAGLVDGRTTSACCRPARSRRSRLAAERGRGHFFDRDRGERDPRSPRA